MTAPPHLPARPGWDCPACGQPWPCERGRTGLLAEFGDSVPVLGMYLAAQMFDAAIDLGVAVDTALYDRFLRWIRPTEEPPWPLRSRPDA